MSDIATVTMSLPAVVAMAMTIAASALGVAGWIVSRIESVRDDLRVTSEATREQVRVVERRVYQLEYSLTHK